jgi:hypothetical protein
MSAVNKTLTDAEEFQMRKVKPQACTSEWTPYLDDFLAQAIIRNYFNFDLVAIELNQEH